MKSKNKIYLLLFGLGLSAGILFAIGKAKASVPAPNTPVPLPSMYYDEHWWADGAVVSSAAGFVGFDHVRPAEHDPTGIAATIEDAGDPADKIIRVFPKMVVTRWQVHGHIHME